MRYNITGLKNPRATGVRDDDYLTEHGLTLEQALDEKARHWGHGERLIPVQETFEDSEGETVTRDLTIDDIISRYGEFHKDSAIVDGNWVLVSERQVDPYDDTADKLGAVINAEWNRANDFALSVVDRNMRETCLNVKANVALGAIPSDHPVLAIIQQYDAAVSAVWPQYYANKARIIAGEDVLDYTAPSVPSEEEFNTALYG